MTDERLKTLESFGQELRRSAATPTGRSRTRLASLVAGALAALATLAVFTGPGQAVAEELGELVGIGEDSTFDHRDDGDFSADGRSVVLAEGVVPAAGPRYEMAAFASKPGQEGQQSVSGSRVATCISLDFPEIDKQADWDTTCFGGGGDGQALRASGITDNVDGRLGPGGRYTLSGSVSTEVDRVEVTYRSGGKRLAAPAVVGIVDEQVAAEIGADAVGGLFYAFIPDDGAEEAAGMPPAVTGTIRIEAVGADGEIIASDDLQSLVSAAKRTRDQMATLCGRMGPEPLADTCREIP